MTTYNLPSAAVNAALSFTLTNTPAIGTNTATALSAGDAQASYAASLSAATLKTVFKFKTDAIDLTDTDAEFVHDITHANFALATGKVVSAATVGSGNVDANGTTQTIEHDYVRHVAHQLLGHRKADIFSNEATLRGVVTAQDGGWVTAIQSALSSNAQDCIDELMDTLTSTEAGRDTLAGLTESSNSAGVATFQFPFANGDSLVIPITFNAITGQAITNSSVTGNVAARTYDVTFNIVA